MTNDPNDQPMTKPPFTELPASARASTNSKKIIPNRHAPKSPRLPRGIRPANGDAERNRSSPIVFCSIFVWFIISPFTVNPFSNHGHSASPQHVAVFKAVKNTAWHGVSLRFVGRVTIGD
jgi:hypothetical protein